MARNKFNRPLLLSVAAAAFTLVAMGGLFVGPSIVECSPDGDNIAGDNIAACLLVDLNERLPLAEALTPLIDENSDPASDVQTEIIEPSVPVVVPQEVAPQDVAPQEVELQEVASPVVELQEALQEPEPQEAEPESSIPEPAQSEIVQLVAAQPEAVPSAEVRPVINEPEITKVETSQPMAAQPEVVQPVASPPVISQPEAISSTATVDEPASEILQLETVQPEIVQLAVIQPEVVPPVEVILENLPEAEVAPDNGVEEIEITEPQNADTPAVEPTAIQRIAIPEIITPADVVSEIVAQKPQQQEPEQQDRQQREPAELETVVIELSQPENVRQELVQLEPVQQIAALTPTPAPTSNKSITLPTIDAVEIDGELNFIAGAGEEGLKIRLFVDNELTGTSIVAGGRWLVEVQNILDANSSRIRADMLDPNSNNLLARTQVNFELEIPGADIDPVELAKPQEVSALSVQELPVQELQPLNLKPENSEQENPQISNEPPIYEQEKIVETEQAEENAPTIMTINIAPPANISPLPDSDVSSPVALILPTNSKPPEPILSETERLELATPETLLPENVLPESMPLEIPTIATEPVEQLMPETAFPEISPTAEQIFLDDDVTEETGVEFIRPGQTIVEDEAARPEELAEIAVASTVAQVTELAINDDNLPAIKINNSPLPSPPDIEQVMVAQAAEPTTTVADVPILEPAQTEPVETEPVAPRQERSNTPTLRAVIVGEPDELRFASGKVIIRTGDNLWTIANRVYGMGRRYVEIYEANIDQISNPHWIYPGQIFELPEN
ncbi:MAG: LysM peptidoglycan-binding domain-containing protein [Devosiaceae bacterium]|nr:LysM peptidoglycan-binding domain-containing protein [Devosiaceae bacterium]